MSTNALQILGMNIGSLTEAMTLAEFFAKSELVPKDYQSKPGNIVVAWQKGFELGLSPSQALESIAVINGRASLWGDTVLAMVRKSGLMESFIEEVTETEAIVTAKRKGEPNPIIRSFSMDDAKKAGLAGKAGPWTNYPKRMMQMRARAFVLRDGFADVLKGMSIAEEAQDIVEAEVSTPNAALSISRMATFSVLNTSLALYGIELDCKDGLAFITKGDTYNNSKTLHELGFYVSDKKWYCKCVDDRNVETNVVTAEVEEQTETISQKTTEQEGESELVKSNLKLPSGVIKELEKIKLSVEYVPSGESVYVKVIGDTAKHEQKLLELGFQNRGDKGWLTKLPPEQKQLDLE